MTPKNVWSRKAHNEFMAWLKQHPEIKTVVIAQLWTSRILSQFKDWNNKIVHDDNLSKQKQNLAETCRQLNSIGCRVVIIGPIPTFSYEPAKEVREAIMRNNYDYKLPELSWSEYIVQSKKMLDFLHESISAVQDGDVHFISIDSGLFEHGILQYKTNDKWNYKDTNHLTPEGSERVIFNVQDKLTPLLSR